MEVDVRTDSSKSQARASAYRIDVWSAAAGVLAVGVLILAGPMGCRKEPATQPVASSAAQAPWFEEVAREVGIDFMLVSGHTNRHWFPEISTGGAGLCDFDGDGFLDIYFPQGHALDPGASAAGGSTRPQGDRPANKLYRNRGDGTFEDVTKAAGVGDTGYGMGCACGDYDNDGDVDLYVTNVGANIL